MQLQKELEKCPVGLGDDVALAAVDALYGVLSATYVLAVKTQNYHWNVVGANFHSLHALFEEQYKEYSVAIDDIAERIRQLGYFVPATTGDYKESSGIIEQTDLPGAAVMLERLLDDNVALANQLRDSLTKLEELGVDQATADMFVQRIAVHDKSSWMLRSHLAK